MVYTRTNTKNNFADVTQSVECDPSKFEVVGSSPIIRFYLKRNYLFFDSPAPEAACTLFRLLVTPLASFAYLNLVSFTYFALLVSSFKLSLAYKIIAYISGTSVNSRKEQ
jgi:hypothetical protein